MPPTGPIPRRFGTVVGHSVYADAVYVGGVLLTPGGGAGTVESVGMTVPSSLLAVTPDTITTTGTFAVSLPARAANLVFAGPATGADAAPTFRALVSDDIPTLPTAKITGLDAAIASIPTLPIAQADVTDLVDDLAGKAAFVHLHMADQILDLNDVIATFTNKTLTSSTNVLGGVTMTLGSDATGDVYYRHSDGTLKRLGVGADGTVLTLASGVPSWASPAGGGITIGTTAISGGATTQVLYNTSGVVDSDSTFVFDDTNKTLGLGAAAVSSSRLYVTNSTSMNGITVNNSYSGGSANAGYESIVNGTGSVGYSASVAGVIGSGVNGGFQATLTSTSASNVGSAFYGDSRSTAASQSMVRLIRDSNFTTTSNVVLRSQHTSSGTPAAGFGSQMYFMLESSTTADQDAAKFIVSWLTATHAAKTSAVKIQGVFNASALQDLVIFNGYGDIEQHLYSTSAASIDNYRTDSIVHTTATAAAGFGVSDQIRLESAGGSTVIASRVDTVWTTATAGGEVARMKWNIQNGGTLTEVMTLNSLELNLPETNAEYRIGGNRVLYKRDTGWSVLTGTPQKTSFATYTAADADATYSEAQVQAVMDALQNVSRRLMAHDELLINHHMMAGT